MLCASLYMQTCA